MTLENCRVGFALTGSFCTLAKAMPVLERLKQSGADITPIMSEAVYSTDTRFGKAEDFIEFTEKTCNKSIIHTVKDAEPIGPKKLLDIIIVLPCTGNTISKIANGINDTSVTMAVKSHLRNNRPVVLGISTNDGLGASGKNIGALLNTKNIFFLPFTQDDPENKPKSLESKMDLTEKALISALEGKQIQPLLWKQ